MCLLIGIDCSAKVVYIREDEWLTIQQLFSVDMELRREMIVDDLGRTNVVFVPGTTPSLPRVGFGAVTLGPTPFPGGRL